MTDASDDQDRAEALDTDKLAGDTDDPTGELDYPPERPMGVDKYGTTWQEERTGEPLDERVARERRSRARRDDEPGPDSVGRLMGPDDGEGEPGIDDNEADAVASRSEEDDDLSAEELAMHVTDDPAWGEPGDGYLGR